jgi:hypothetical protein
VNIPTLDHLLRMIDEKIGKCVESGNVRLVRHVMSNRKDGDWSGFDNKLKFDNELLKVFTAEQVQDKFKNAELILVFVAEEGTRCLLRGAFWCKGKTEYKNFVIDYPKHLEFEAFKRERGIRPVDSSTGLYYKLEECGELAPYFNRLVIDWGKATVTWVQSILTKEIWELRPKGFVSTFPGWINVFISHQELKAIVANPEGNKDWFQFLSEHDGVYVILDTKTGKKYVGSAYASSKSKSGLWGRWCGYARTGDNGNQALRELSDIDPNHAENFMYSIHHVFPKGTKTSEEVIGYESLLKEKLGTRGSDGLNRN